MQWLTENIITYECTITTNVKTLAFCRVLILGCFIWTRLNLNKKYVMLYRFFKKSIWYYVFLKSISDEGIFLKVLNFERRFEEPWIIIALLKFINI